jgi:MFS transporter, FSR family, fosmidomycin resistance protein
MGYSQGSMFQKNDKKIIAALSLGHFVNDSYSNMLGPLLPLLMIKLDFSMSQAGFLGSLLVFSSSLTQPIYGYLGDRYVHRAFAVYGPLMTALFLSMIGLAPSYSWLAVLLMLGGIGIASFHPQGAAMVSAAGRDRKGLSMSIFVTSGSLGYAIGPTLATLTILYCGLEYSYITAVPGILVVLFLMRMVPVGLSSVKSAEQRQDGPSLRSMWKPLTILYLLVVIRSAVQSGLSQFLPLYYHQKGFSIREGAFFLTLFLVSGGIGGFFGGHFADRFGGKRVIVLSMLATSPLLLGFLFFPGALSIISLMLTGLFLLSTIPINVVIAQQMAPHHSSTISAMMMGFAWGAGGIFFLPVTGYLADHYGFTFTYALTAVLPLIGFLLSLSLPAHLDMKSIHTETAASTVSETEEVLFK